MDNSGDVEVEGATRVPSQPSELGLARTSEASPLPQAILRNLVSQDAACDPIDAEGPARRGSGNGNGNPNWSAADFQDHGVGGPDNSGHDASFIDSTPSGGAARNFGAATTTPFPSASAASGGRWLPSPSPAAAAAAASPAQTAAGSTAWEDAAPLGRAVAADAIRGRTHPTPRRELDGQLGSLAAHLQDAPLSQQLLPRYNIDYNASQYDTVRGHQRGVAVTAPPALPISVRAGGYYGSGGAGRGGGAAAAGVSPLPSPPYVMGWGNDMAAAGVEPSPLAGRAAVPAAWRGGVGGGRGLQLLQQRYVPYPSATVSPPPPPPPPGANHGANGGRGGSTTQQLLSSPLHRYHPAVQSVRLGYGSAQEDLDQLYEQQRQQVLQLLAARNTAAAALAGGQLHPPPPPPKGAIVAVDSDTAGDESYLQDARRQRPRQQRDETPGNGNADASAAGDGVERRRSKELEPQSTERTARAAEGGGNDGAVDKRDMPPLPYDAAAAAAAAAATGNPVNEGRIQANPDPKEEAAENASKDMVTVKEAGHQDVPALPHDGVGGERTAGATASDGNRNAGPEGKPLDASGGGGGAKAGRESPSAIAAAAAAAAAAAWFREQMAAGADVADVATRTHATQQLVPPALTSARTPTLTPTPAVQLAVPPRASIPLPPLPPPPPTAQPWSPPPPPLQRPQQRQAPAAATAPQPQIPAPAPPPLPHSPVPPPLLPLTVAHSDRKCPKLLAPRSGRLGDVKHLVLPAEIAQALPAALRQGDRPMRVRFLLLRAGSLQQQQQQQLGQLEPEELPATGQEEGQEEEEQGGRSGVGEGRVIEEAQCCVGNGPGGNRAVQIPVSERTFGRPTEFFRLLPDLTLELGLGERVVQPSPLPPRQHQQPHQQQQSAVRDSTAATAAAAGCSAVPKAHVREGGVVVKQEREGAQQPVVGMNWEKEAEAAMAGAGVGLGEDDDEEGEAEDDEGSPGGGRGGGGGGAAAAADARTGGGKWVAFDAPSPLFQVAGAGNGNGNGGRLLQQPLYVRRRYAGRQQPTVMRSSSGIVGRRKHLPLPPQILEALPPDQRRGVKPVTVRVLLGAPTTAALTPTTPKTRAAAAATTAALGPATAAATTEVAAEAAPAAAPGGGGDGGDAPSAAVDADPANLVVSAAAPSDTSLDATANEVPASGIGAVPAADAVAATDAPSVPAAPPPAAPAAVGSSSTHAGAAPGAATVAAGSSGGEENTVADGNKPVAPTPVVPPPSLSLKEDPKAAAAPPPQQYQQQRQPQGPPPLPLLEQLSCTIGPSGSHGCMALQLPVSERMWNRPLLYYTLQTDGVVELVLGQVLEGAAPARAAAAAAAAAALAAEAAAVGAARGRNGAGRRRRREEVAREEEESGAEGGGGMDAYEYEEEEEEEVGPRQRRGNGKRMRGMAARGADGGGSGFGVSNAAEAAAEAALTRGMGRGGDATAAATAAAAADYMEQEFGSSDGAAGRPGRAAAGFGGGDEYGGGDVDADGGGDMDGNADVGGDVDALDALASAAAAASRADQLMLMQHQDLDEEAQRYPQQLLQQEGLRRQQQQRAHNALLLRHQQQQLEQLQLQLRSQHLPLQQRQQPQQQQQQQHATLLAQQLGRPAVHAVRQLADVRQQLPLSLQQSLPPVLQQYAAQQQTFPPLSLVQQQHQGYRGMNAHSQGGLHASASQQQLLQQQLLHHLDLRRHEYQHQQQRQPSPTQPLLTLQQPQRRQQQQQLPLDLASLAAARRGALPYDSLLPGSLPRGGGGPTATARALHGGRQGTASLPHRYSEPYLEYDYNDVMEDAGGDYGDESACVGGGAAAGRHLRQRLPQSIPDMLASAAAGLAASDNGTPPPPPAAVAPASQTQPGMVQPLQRRRTPGVSGHLGLGYTHCLASEGAATYGGAQDDLDVDGGGGGGGAGGGFGASTAAAAPAASAGRPAPPAARSPGSALAGRGPPRVKEEDVEETQSEADMYGEAPKGRTAAAAAPHPPPPGPSSAARAAAATLGQVWSLLLRVPREQTAATKALAAAQQRSNEAGGGGGGGEGAAVLASFRGCLTGIFNLLLQAREAAAADAARQQPQQHQASGDGRTSQCLFAAAPVLLTAAEFLGEWYGMLAEAAEAGGTAAAAATAAELQGSATLVRAQLAEALTPLTAPPPQQQQPPGLTALAAASTPPSGV